MDVGNFKEGLRNDPLLVEYFRRQIQAQEKGEQFFIKNPLNALAEKRAFILGLLSPELLKFQIVGGRAQKDELEHRWNLATMVKTASVVFFDNDPWSLFIDLTKKVKQSYESFTDKPSAKKLPFKSMWLTKTGSWTTSLGDVDAVLCYEFEGRFLNFGFSNEPDGTLKVIAQAWDNQAETDALAIFLEEKIVNLEKKICPRSFRKAQASLGLDSNESVSVLTLRTRENRKESDGASTNREYYHQWLVRGHVRNQWYPSRGVHEVKWIDPYVKGPDDMPFKETVRHVKF